MTWTPIPRWLYENDLPDGQLQEVYVREARKKLAELEAARRELDGHIEVVEAFLAEAEAALARYQRRRRGP